MGMDRLVALASENIPLWSKVSERMAARGLPCKLMMIDGQPAFPDEEPPDNWRELRVGAADGMVTLRREENGVRLVVWGNADQFLQRLWNELAAAFSEG